MSINMFEHVEFFLTRAFVSVLDPHLTTLLKFVCMIKKNNWAVLTPYSTWVYLSQDDKARWQNHVKKTKVDGAKPSSLSMEYMMLLD